MADWPSITDDDNTGLTGTVFNKAFFNLIKAFIQAGSHQSGLDANKPAECSPGDVYHATDTEIYYVCFLANSWFGVGGGANPEQVRLPDPEAENFATPSSASASSEGGGGYILNQTLWDSSQYLFNGSYVRAAQRIVLTGQTLEYVRFYLKKSGSPTGTVYARVRRVSDDGVIETSATTLDISTLTTEYAWKEFPLTCSPDEDVRICIEFSEGNDTNKLVVGYYTTDVCDGCFSKYTPWTDFGTFEATIIIMAAALYPASNTIDDNTVTYWLPEPANEAGAWIKFDLGSLKYIGGCRIYWGSEAAYRPTEYKIYTSPDDSTWTEVIHETQAAPASAWKEYNWYVRKARYIKMVVTTHGASGTKVYEADEYSSDQDGVILTHGHGGLS